MAYQPLADYVKPKLIDSKNNYFKSEYCIIGHISRNDGLKNFTLTGHSECWVCTGKHRITYLIIWHEWIAGEEQRAIVKFQMLSRQGLGSWEYL